MTTYRKHPHTLRFSFILLFLLLVSVGTSAQSDEEVERPEAPDGFTWQEMPKIKGAILMPEGWHFKAHEEEGARAYFISAENIDEKGFFLTGLSMNVITSVPERTGVSAPEYAAGIAGAVSEVPGTEVVDSWSNAQGPFHIYGVRYSGTKPGGSKSMIHQLTVANDDTGTLYLITFESPTDEWDEAWKIGDWMMSRFILDESV